MREYSKSVVLSFDEAINKNISDEDLATFKKVANKMLDLISSKKIYN
jgi:hypothetical protein